MAVRGLPMGQEDQKPKRGGLTADLTFEAHAFSCGSWLASDDGLTVDHFLFRCTRIKWWELA